MRKALALLLTFSLAFSLVACKSEPAHEHVWQDATYQQAKTCTECGEVEGEPLTAFFVENGYVPTLEVGPTYDYYTICNEKTDLPTVGKLTISEYTTISGDETFPELQGYEWRIVKYGFTYSDENAQGYGMRTRCAINDYYNGDMTGTMQENNPSLEVYYNGETYYCTYNAIRTRGEWEGDTYYVTFTLGVQVPIGYDGVVLTFYNAAHANPNDGAYLTEDAVLQDIVDENTIFFRMD